MLRDTLAASPPRCGNQGQWREERDMATMDTCPTSPRKDPHGRPGGPGPCCWAVTGSASGNAKAPSGPWPPSPEGRTKLDRQEDGTEGPALAGATVSQIGCEQSYQHCTGPASSTQVRDNGVQTQGPRARGRQAPSDSGAWALPQVPKPSPHRAHLQVWPSGSPRC